MRKLFVGKLSRRTRQRDIEELFERYGRMTRCDVKYAPDNAFAFIDYEHDADAEKSPGVILT